MSETHVIVSGCTGRMGKSVVGLVNQHPDWKVVGGFGLGKHQYKFPVLGVGAFEAKKLFELEKPDVIIDFSSPDATECLYFDYAIKYSVPLVCGTTKLDIYLLENMKMQNCIPVFQSYNFLTNMKFTQNVCDATGVIKATEFLLKQPAGYYNMDSLIN